MTLVDAAVYIDGRRVSSGTAAETLADARARGGMAWIGLYRPEIEEMNELAAVLGLHPLAVEDALKGHQRAKLEQYGDMTFLVLQPARYLDASETVEFGEVHIFVGPDYVITIRHAENPDLGAVRHRLEGRPDVLAQGPFAVVWAVCDDIVDQYQPVVAGVENDIDEIEDELFSRDPAVSQRIFGLQREVIDLQHATTPLVDIFDRLQEIVIESTGATEAPAIRDVDDHARRIVEKVDGFRPTLDSALTVHATMVDQDNNEAMRRIAEFGIQQNEQVKKVSGWAAILFAPTLVGTIYGMNFDHMPELHWTLGYPMALALMATTSVTLYVIFKRKGWL
ncbi:magnesium and cobalt transport protein CorA [Microbacterium sp. CFBP9034]|uniref:magnesium and cobalt transport protein CorA n=1 Tax=Microbacterium sp. CFBP9034 TaxID=3096540 RepID=UPI002A69C0E8|nr:magnesium and cobalt transport protein CorA [Microbacterium sp. CFBP9034]MDY0911034.1 magnesium and cobalt transport protein CorA [Microbacterium sp. CFBP9034]